MIQSSSSMAAMGPARTASGATWPNMGQHRFVSDISILGMDIPNITESCQFLLICIGCRNQLDTIGLEIPAGMACLEFLFADFLGIVQSQGAHTGDPTGTDYPRSIGHTV